MESRVVCIAGYYFKIITKWPEETSEINKADEINEANKTNKTKDQEVLTNIDRISQQEAERTPEILSMSSRVQAETAKQLEEYFAGTRKVFDLPLCPEGTDFQKRVWKALLEIPYGETRTYQEIAQKAGSPRGFRAVGMANHNNPIMIVIPCHRVIGKDGSLTGYGGGLDMKERLLKLESTGV